MMTREKRVGSVCWVGVGGLFCCLQSSPLACVPLQKEWIAVGRGRGASEVEVGATWCWFSGRTRGREFAWGLVGWC